MLIVKQWRRGGINSYYKSMIFHGGGADDGGGAAGEGLTCKIYALISSLPVWPENHERKVSIFYD